MADERELKRARLSGPNADADQWDFLEPWCEQLQGRLLLYPGGFIDVLEPGAHRYRRDEDKTQVEALASKQYATDNWHTREALELLTLVHCVSRTSWKKVLVEKFHLRFGEEEDNFNAINDIDEDDEDLVGHAERGSLATFECERDRDLPASPQFAFELGVGSQKPGKPSPIAKWTTFFMAHESDYSPSPEFLTARDRIVRG
jgi:hypothetical protein